MELGAFSLIKKENNEDLMDLKGRIFNLPEECG
jgi:hypothetical protein